MILATENFLTDWNRHAFGKPSQRRLRVCWFVHCTCISKKIMIMCAMNLGEMESTDLLGVTSSNV